jgi:hypothetical protein
LKPLAKFLYLLLLLLFLYIGVYLALSGFLWADHNLAKVKEQWRLHGGPALLDEYGPDADPITLFDELTSDLTPVRYDR